MTGKAAPIPPRASAKSVETDDWEKEPPASARPFFAGKGG